MFNYFSDQFLTQNWLTGQVGRSLGRLHQGPVDRRAQSCAQSCARQQPSGPVDRPVDRTRELCSLYLGGRPGGRPDSPNGQKYDRWRSTGQSTASLSGCQISLRLVSGFGLYKP